MLQYFSFASLLALLTHAYFALRFAPSRGLTNGRRWGFLVLLSCNVLVLPAALVVTLRAPVEAAWWAVPLAHLAFADAGFCVLLATGLLVRDIVWTVGSWLVSWRAPRDLAPAQGENDASRRRLLQAALGRIVAGGAAGSTIVGYGVALSQPELRRVTVPIASVPSSWAGLRIVQISDLHVGPTIRRGYVEKLVASVNALTPDLIVITGDLVDGFVAQLAEQIEPLRALRAPHGVHFVTGNHEHYYQAPQWIDLLASMGIHVLSNAHVVLEHAGVRVMMAGVDDPAGTPASHRADRISPIERAIESAPDVALRILLAHRPTDVSAASTHGFDLQLSGHVHGGQFFPFTLVTRLLERYVAGMYRVKNTWLYVNRGAGYWGPPNRLGARQEIALLEIVPQQP